MGKKEQKSSTSTSTWLAVGAVVGLAAAGVFMGASYLLHREKSKKELLEEIEDAPAPARMGADPFLALVSAKKRKQSNTHAKRQLNLSVTKPATETATATATETNGIVASTPNRRVHERFWKSGRDGDASLVHLFESDMDESLAELQDIAVSPIRHTGVLESYYREVGEAPSEEESSDDEDYLTAEEGESEFAEFGTLGRKEPQDTNAEPHVTDTNTEPHVTDTNTEPHVTDTNAEPHVTDTNTEDTQRKKNPGWMCPRGPYCSEVFENLLNARQKSLLDTAKESFHHFFKLMVTEANDNAAHGWTAMPRVGCVDGWEKQTPGTHITCIKAEAVMEGRISPEALFLEHWLSSAEDQKAKNKYLLSYDTVEKVCEGVSVLREAYKVPVFMVSDRDACMLRCTNVNPDACEKGQKYDMCAIWLQSITHEACPIDPNYVRAKVLVSGSIFERLDDGNRMRIRVIAQVDPGGYLPTIALQRARGLAQQGVAKLVAKYSV